MHAAHRCKPVISLIAVIVANSLLCAGGTERHQIDVIDFALCLVLSRATLVGASAWIHMAI